MKHSVISEKFQLTLWYILAAIAIEIPQNLYGALYKQSSANSAWQLKIKKHRIKITNGIKQSNYSTD